MAVTRDLLELIETDRSDVFSISLDVDPAKPEHQTVQPAYVIHLKNGIRDILESLPKRTRKRAAAVGSQILASVEMMRPEGRGLAIFVAPDLWRQQFFPFSLPTRIAYGRPDVMPVLWTVDEYEPYAILVVNSERARILVAHLGAAAVMEQDVLVLDTTEWRFTAGRPPSFTRTAGIGAGRGAQRDIYDARVDDHVRRFWTGAAEAAARWLDELQVDRLILAGPSEATAAVEHALPDRTRSKLAATLPMAADAGLPEIRERTLEAAIRSERSREEELMAVVLNRTGRPAGSVTGVEATLEAIQRGEAMTVIADRDLTGMVGRCRRCGYVTAKPRQRCEVCRGKVDQVTFPQVLPLLVRRSGARLELVGQESAGALRALGGMAAILRFRPAAPAAASPRSPQ